jgi:hypothetical protein
MTDAKNKENIIKLAKNINFDLINFDLIKKNADFLYEEGLKLREIWNTLPTNHNNYNKHILSNNNTEHEYIYNIIKTSQLSNYKEFDKYLVNNNLITKYNYKAEEIKFYVIKQDLNKDDEKKIINMIKIAASLKKYFNDNNKTIIVWIPIDRARDFDHKSINSDTLNISRNDFKAFTASGLTYGDKERITVITRYEEIEKLLIHELAHNYGIDGSLSHNHEFKELNDEYTKTKNKLSNKKKNFDYRFSIYESYAELSSSYFNLIFININKKSMREKLVMGITLELLYSYNTICNLAKLNGYSNYNDFMNNKVFQGEICFFEYYYLKGLMYNNYVYRIIKNSNDDPNKLYNDVIGLINKKDALLEDIYKNQIEQKNFKFCYH